MPSPPLRSSSSAALFGRYLRTIGSSSAEGAASAPLALLVWIYFEVQILLADVQLTKVMHERRIQAAGGAILDG